MVVLTSWCGYFGCNVFPYNNYTTSHVMCMVSLKELPLYISRHNKIPCSNTLSHRGTYTYDVTPMHSNEVMMY